MKIGIISHSYPSLPFPHHGTFVHDHTKLLGEMCDVTVYLLSPRALPFSAKFRENACKHEEPNLRRVRYVSVPAMNLPQFTRRNQAKSIMKVIDRETDLFHAHFFYPGLLSIPALKNNGYPCVATSHGSDFYKSVTKPPVKKILSDGVRALDRIFAVGNRLKSDIEMEYVEARSKTFVTHNPIDTETFDLPNSKVEVRRKLGWDTSAKHLLYIGNFRHEKGADILLDALQDVPVTSEQLHLHLIGDMFSDGYEAEVKQKINQLHEVTVTYSPAVPRKELISYYQAADMLISPSRTESFGMVIAETLACGTPALVTMSGGPQEIVTEESGLLVESESPKALASGIKTMLSSLSDFDSQKIRRTITSRFSRQIIQENLLKHYEEILRRK